MTVFFRRPLMFLPNNDTNYFPNEVVDLIESYLDMDLKKFRELYCLCVLEQCLKGSEGNSMPSGVIKIIMEYNKNELITSTSLLFTRILKPENYFNDQIENALLDGTSQATKEGIPKSLPDYLQRCNMVLNRLETLALSYNTITIFSPTPKDAHLMQSISSRGCKLTLIHCTEQGKKQYEALNLRNTDHRLIDITGICRVTETIFCQAYQNNLTMEQMKEELSSLMDQIPKINIARLINKSNCIISMFAISRITAGFLDFCQYSLTEKYGFLKETTNLLEPLIATIQKQILNQFQYLTNKGAILIDIAKIDKHSPFRGLSADAMDESLGSFDMEDREEIENFLPGRNFPNSVEIQHLIKK